jgi:hypothetical protein
MFSFQTGPGSALALVPTWVGLASECEMHDADDIRGQNGEDTPDAAATYIASLVDELAQLAKRNGLETLSYILDMARLEADQVSQEFCQARRHPRSRPPRTTN